MMEQSQSRPNILLIHKDQQRGDSLGVFIVVFASDHGELGGDAGLLYKCCFLDSSVRVPLLISTPETRTSQTEQRIDAPVEWRDIGPTLVEFAGGRIDHPQGARSLGPLLADPSVSHRGFAVSEIDEEICLFSREWKLALNREGECYLLIGRCNDPEETRNLAALPAHPETELKLTSIARDILATNAGGAAHLIDNPWRNRWAES
jgi:choline-sulfatase